MSLRTCTKLVPALAAVLALAAFAAAGASADSGIPLAGTGSPQTGAFSPSGVGLPGLEFAEGEDEDAPAVELGVVNRSLSTGVGKGSAARSAAVVGGNAAVTTSFEGLNHYQQRFARGGNQFSVEPPDQGLCVGNGYEVELVNDVMNIFDASGRSVLPDNTATNIVSGFPRDVNHAVDLNSFYGYAPAIDRAHGNVRGPFVTDPSCLYDQQTNRFFAVVLTLEVNPATGAFLRPNHLDIAVSQTGDPRGRWNIYRVDVTNDGSASGVNACPCLGDYPHIGADANGFYVTTNSYPWATDGFDGAQIYAFSKAQLAAGAATVAMQHFNTYGMVNVPTGETPSINQPGFTVWPAQSPDASSFDSSNGGTEYFLSSNAADEATHPVSGHGGNYTSNQIVLWTLKNTSSLNSATPSLTLTNKVLTVDQYGIPPQATQPGTGSPPGVGSPQGHCLNDETTNLFNGDVGCWKLLVTAAAHIDSSKTPPAVRTEVIPSIDANDTRMQQVWFAGRKLWGALDTAVSFGNSGSTAGIAWYEVDPAAGTLLEQGTLGRPNVNLTYPAIAVTAAGRGVIAVTLLGPNDYPSAAYVNLRGSIGNSRGAVVAHDIHVVGEGAADDDGFSGYKQTRFPNPVRPRWGDYGAAVVDGSSIWIASEYIAHACDYTTYGGPFFLGGTGDNILGTCAGPSHGPGPRSASANWSTRITQLTP